MKLSKCPGEHECHDQYSEPQDHDVLRLPKLEPANAGHQYITHNQIEHSPQDVDHRRRQALPGGDANGLWNGLPEMPLTRCGIVFARKAPPKNQAISDTSVSRSA